MAQGFESGISLKGDCDITGVFKRNGIVLEAAVQFYEQLTDVTVSNTATETTLTDSANAVPGSSLTLPANVVRAGSVLELATAGLANYAPQPGGTLALWQWRLGGYVMAAGQYVPFTNISNIPWHMSARIVIRDAGSSGVVKAFGLWTQFDSFGADQRSQTGIDFTSTQALDFTLTWTDGHSSSNAITCTQCGMRLTL